MDVLVPRLENAPKGRPLNYRHAFHAGNFADLAKHALLLSLLARLQRDAAPLTVIDSHAGAGLYALDGGPAQSSGEAEAGIGRLMAEPNPPGPLAALKAAVGKLSSKGKLKLYPGSPKLVADRLRPVDRLVACELRPDDAGLLRQALKGATAEVLVEDGFALAAKRAAPKQRLLVLMDPPFERPDDYARAADTAAAIVRRNPAAVVMIWLPLKDLETFDGFLRRLEGGPARAALVAETRLRPLDDPMKMNGCALVIVGAPKGLEDEARAVCDWVARVCGGPAGEGRVWNL
jgi:23S rRNA (adenine2030-N6)-methyltransferase